MRKLILAIAALLLGANVAMADCGYTGWNFTNQDNSGNIDGECNDTGNG